MKKNDVWVCKWRVSLTSGLTDKNFISQGLPPPDNSIYREFSERRAQSTGSESRQGYATVSIQWDQLSPAQAQVLRGFAEPSSLIYLTISKNNADALEDAFIDVSGYPILPAFDTLPRSRDRSYLGPVLTVNNLTVLNDPAVYS